MNISICLDSQPTICQQNIKALKSADRTDKDAETAAEGHYSTDKHMLHHLIREG